MSIIRNAYLTLETIVSTSNLIVEVEAIEPYEESIPTPTESQNSVAPDFIKRGFIFQVKRVLKNTSEGSMPEIVRVPDESWKRHFSQHKEQYANGPSKSFTINTYDTKVSSMNEADILFLSRHQDTFNLTAKDAFESLASLKTIEELIK